MTPALVRSHMACAALACALVPSGITHAQTVVNGGEIGNEVWTEAGSPYLLNGDLIVPEGRALVLEAGTQVVVGSSDLQSTGDDLGRIELVVRGELSMNGTLSKPVRLWNEEASSQTSWYGIVVSEQALQARLLYTEVSNALSGLESRAPAASVDIVASTFALCDYGLDLQHGAARADRILVRDSRYAIRIQDDGGMTLSNSVLRNNDYGLVLLFSSASIQNTTLLENEFGLRVGGTSSRPSSIRLTDSILADNVTQLNVGTNSTLTVSHSNLWPAATVSSRITLGEGMLSVDPEFVAAPDDLHLRATSPCIDAGSSGTASDHDFERNGRPLDGDGDGVPLPDMGAYELFRRALCGDERLDAGEQCDDGDANGSYGFCNENCSGMGPFCGDGLLHLREECDDGNLQNGDGCDDSCRLAGAGGTGGGGGTGDGGAGGSANGGGGVAGSAGTGPLAGSGGVTGSGGGAQGGMAGEGGVGPAGMAGNGTGGSSGDASSVAGSLSAGTTAMTGGTSATSSAGGAGGDSADDAGGDSGSGRDPDKAGAPSFPPGGAGEPGDPQGGESGGLGDGHGGLSAGRPSGAGVAGRPAATTPRPVDAGCACRSAPATSGGTSWLPIATLLAFSSLRVRRRRPRACSRHQSDELRSPRVSPRPRTTGLRRRG